MSKLSRDGYSQPDKSWKPGLVYVIDYGDSKSFKIGFTTLTAEQRLKQIARSGAVIMPMHLVMSFDVDSNARQLEGLVHMRLDDKHNGGEWYSLDFPDLVEIYQALHFFGIPKLYPRWYSIVPVEYEKYIEHCSVTPRYPDFVEREARIPGFIDDGWEEYFGGN